MSIKTSVSLPELDNVRSISITPDAAGVLVELREYKNKDFHNKDFHICRMSWDKVNDVEFLSVEFEYETVKVFAVLVTLLGELYMQYQLGTLFTVTE